MADFFSVEEIIDVISGHSEGQVPAVVVGGQAINIWATVYRNRIGASLDPYLPLVSKDLDLIGPTATLHELSGRFGVPVEFSEPRTPCIGRIVLPQPKGALKVELLRGVNGLSEIRNYHMLDATISGRVIRVLDPISCLRAKIANVAEIEQQNRQDVKHVKIMTHCVPEYIKDLLLQATEGTISERFLVNTLHELRMTVGGIRAGNVVSKHAVDLSKVLPLEELKVSSLQKVENFIGFHLKDFPGYRTPPAEQNPGNRQGIRM